MELNSTNSFDEIKVKEIKASLEFARTSYILIPSSMSDYHETFLIDTTGKGTKKPRQFCSCTPGSYAKCKHATLLFELYSQYHQLTNGVIPFEVFEKSIWYQLLEPFWRTSSVSISSMTTEQISGFTSFLVKSSPLLTFYGSDKSRDRLIGRVKNSHTTAVARKKLMNKAIEFVLTEQEKKLLALGHKTQRQATEDSFWYLLAYHCFREFTSEKYEFSTIIDSDSGIFSFFVLIEGKKILDITVPEKAVPSLLSIIQKKLGTLTVDTQEVDIKFKIVQKNDNAIIRPFVNIESESEVHSVDLDKKFIYENTLYYPGNSTYYKFTYNSLKLLAMGWHTEKIIPSDQLSSFLVSNAAIFSTEDSEASEGAALNLFSNAKCDNFKRIEDSQIIRSFERIEIRPIALDGNYYTIEIDYCAQGKAFPLSLLLSSNKEKKRFLSTDGCIIDLSSELIRTALLSTRNKSEKGILRVSKAALLQFRTSPIATSISGDTKIAQKLRDLLDLKPTQELATVNGYKSTLRPYQYNGVQWLLFLYDNGLGGLLCDDMGLGKSHQILGLITAIREQRNNTDPFLIVCPTTVLSHWKKLIETFTPDLNLHVYHTQRTELSLTGSDIVITSYGVVRNDIDYLSSLKFEIAIFDEAQQLKNAESLSTQAVQRLKSKVCFGLSGTPIENSLSDIKTLFDIVLPGFLAEDHVPLDEMVVSSDILNQNHSQIFYFKRLISPFILRRHKHSVLSELPPKTEEIRTCKMLPEQEKLYKTALNERCDPLLVALKNDNIAVPYMHIFALLGYLKQVCDHPSLVDGSQSEFEKQESGKWELFKELLQESLDSGQKIVVFSQFLGMIDIIKSHLDKKGIGNVTLTGASRNRDQIINTFTNDSSCKVFIGSLKAGGVGIDLVSASVVIHYDRWWNAAKEDQATDRVYRMGQSRGVQVFKLVTESTIEERIASIIDRKRVLTEVSLDEDSPDMIKSFSRDELLDILGPVRN